MAVKMISRHSRVWSNYARPKSLSFPLFSAPARCVFRTQRVFMKPPINGMKVRLRRSQVHASRTKVHAKRMKVLGQVSGAEEAERLRTAPVAVLPCLRSQITPTSEFYWPSG